MTGLIKDNHWRALNPGTLAFEGRFPLHDAAQAALGVPVVLANDAQAAAWGEYAHGAGQGKDIVFLTVSTASAAAWWRMAAFCRAAAASRGISGRSCPCPKAPRPGSRTALGPLDRVRGRAAWPCTDARAVFAAAAAGNAGAEAVIETSAARVARLCHDLQLMFDPRYTVIGGGVGLASGYIDVWPGRWRISSPWCVDTCSAALGRDAGVIGIADLAKRKQPTERRPHDLQDISPRRNGGAGTSGRIGGAGRSHRAGLARRPRGSRLRAVTEIYNAKPDLAEENKVELLFTSRDGFFDKLQVDLAAGSTAFDVNLIATYSIGRYAPFMEPVALSDQAGAVFGDTVLKTMQFNGQQYGVPTDCRCISSTSART